ncbi:flagellar motor protein MotB [Pseudovibrio sp. SPO723]|uniref:flagellar motor protein MotB n=1 Tax=Nesiotobacter zosterae TaxID=392721 RepID=UPI0029C3E434|nr:flagellar motor protein MotB [Pseudovibrio sp. SPO723]MDX5593672.1 flagellar motor protein MotB [Pseudovibrio sp. SPO723]
MAEKEQSEIIIVRRRNDDMDQGVKSGVWKIAYADFTTAMMAFFLVMWLVNASDNATRQGVVAYFNPMKIVDTASERKGLRDPEDENPPAEGNEGVDDMKKAGEGGTELEGPTTGGGSDKAEPITEDVDKQPKGPGQTADSVPGEASRMRTPQAGEAGRYTEQELFDNPYAILAALAVEAEALVQTDGSAGQGGPGSMEAATTPVLFARPNRDPDGQGLADGSSFRDPFDPSGWQSEELPGNSPLLARVPIVTEVENGLDVTELSAEQIRVLEDAKDLARAGISDPNMEGSEEALTSGSSVVYRPEAGSDTEGLEQGTETGLLERAETQEEGGSNSRVIVLGQSPENVGLDPEQQEFAEIAGAVAETRAVRATQSEADGSEQAELAANNAESTEFNVSVDETSEQTENGSSELPFNGTSNVNQNGTSNFTENGSSGEAENGTSSETDTGTSSQGEDGTSDQPLDGETNVALVGVSDKSEQGIGETKPTVPQAKPVDAQELAEIRSEIGNALKGVASGASIDFSQNANGVLIQIMDNERFGMFAVGSAEPRPQVVAAMERIAEVLKSKKGAIVIRGHTDSRPFRSRDYDNWRLSTARAHMAYYMLLRGGIPEDRIVGIEGYADKRPKIAGDTLAPQNRRIEIMLLNDTEV